MSFIKFNVQVKLVLAAAFWTVPHLVVMDEPTNFLDREALGALSAALNEWGGAVLMISHNREFYSSVCKEEWHVADGQVDVQGASTEREMKAVARKKTYEKELDNDEVLEKVSVEMQNSEKFFSSSSYNFALHFRQEEMSTAMPTSTRVSFLNQCCYDTYGKFSPH